VPMAFLHAVMLGRRSYILRALQPLEDRVPLAKSHHDIENLAGVMRVMGQCTAWDHLRSSGRQGSATADELIAFANQKSWGRELLAAAKALSSKVEQDWQTYCDAFDAGGFAIEGYTNAPRNGGQK